MKTSTVDDPSPMIEANRNEQYGGIEKMRIFGIEEKPDEGVFAKVVSVAEEAGVTVTANDVGTYHSLSDGRKVR